MNHKRQSQTATATEHRAQEDKPGDGAQAGVQMDGRDKADGKMMKMPEAQGSRHQEAPQGEPVIGEKTIWWALAGLLIGLFVGWLIGLAFGYGRLNVPGLAPLVAGGASVPGLIFACFFGALFGLAGGLLGTASEARANTKEQLGMKHSQQSFIQQLPIYGSIALALLMA